LYFFFKKKLPLVLLGYVTIERFPEFY